MCLFHLKFFILSLVGMNTLTLQPPTSNLLEVRNGPSHDTTPTDLSKVVPYPSIHFISYFLSFHALKLVSSLHRNFDRIKFRYKATTKISQRHH